MKQQSYVWYLIVAWLSGGSIGLGTVLHIPALYVLAPGVSMVWLSMTLWMMIHKRRY